MTIQEVMLEDTQTYGVEASLQAVGTELAGTMKACYAFSSRRKLKEYRTYTI